MSEYHPDDNDDAMSVYSMATNNRDVDQSQNIDQWIKEYQAKNMKEYADVKEEIEGAFGEFKAR